MPCPPLSPLLAHAPASQLACLPRSFTPPAPPAQAGVARYRERPGRALHRRRDHSGSARKPHPAQPPALLPAPLAWPHPTTVDPHCSPARRRLRPAHPECVRRAADRGDDDSGDGAMSTCRAGRGRARGPEGQRGAREGRGGTEARSPAADASLVSGPRRGKPLHNTNRGVQPTSPLSCAACAFDGAGPL